MKAACPQCGADVEFRFDDTFVRVCDHCRAACVRTDRGLDTLGAFADLAETRSPLALWATGTWRGDRFQLVGRAQLHHQAGGSWDEWYARFDDGRWGWLSEAQGRFYVMFERGHEAPPADAVHAGDAIELAGVARMSVSEVGVATYVAAAGEIPFRLGPGTTYRYADLSGAGGAFATIDYSDAPPTVYAGDAASLDELHITGGATAAPAAPSIRAKRLACPSCDGALELRAPDATLRVGCPFCGALIDVSGGELAVLAKLAADDSVDTPAIPLGTTCRFEDHELTVIGWLRRGAIVDGTTYPFEEYLLYEPSLGFRWLVESDGNWSYVVPVDAGAIDPNGPTYDGVRFRRYQQAPLVVKRVLGEMYWKVEVGERVTGTDYVAPPAMLSKEASDDEITWSLGTFVSHAELERSLGGTAVSGFAQATAPNAPPLLRGIWPITGVVLAGLLLSMCVVSGTSSSTQVTSMTCDDRSKPPPPSDPTFTPPANSAVCFSEPFALDGGRNVVVTLRGNVDNSWISVGGDLVDEATGQVESFDRDLEQYHGFEDGESWSEGSREERVFLAPVPEGRYVLRLELQGQNPSYQVDATVTQGVFHMTPWLWLAGLVLLPGLVLGGIAAAREQQRWKDASP